MGGKPPVEDAKSAVNADLGAPGVGAGAGRIADAEKKTKSNVTSRSVAGNDRGRGTPQKQRDCEDDIIKAEKPLDKAPNRPYKGKSRNTGTLTTTNRTIQ